MLWCFENGIDVSGDTLVAIVGYILGDDTTPRSKISVTAALSGKPCDGTFYCPCSIRRHIANYLRIDKPVFDIECPTPHATSFRLEGARAITFVTRDNLVYVDPAVMENEPESLPHRAFDQRISNAKVTDKGI